ncbi:hypothetical protein BBU72A_I0035 (plasmid) [Borreliella burgdorferi 72a]|nr:hypothetical protein BBU72A_I0035 [Borreliella burgdorferi 72a]
MCIISEAIFFISKKFSKESLSFFKTEVSNFSKLSFLGYKQLTIFSKLPPVS